MLNTRKTRLVRPAVQQCDRQTDGQNYTHIPRSHIKRRAVKYVAKTEL